MKKVVKRKAGQSSRKLRELDAEHRTVEPGLRYWAMHVLHWCALLACVVAFIYIGYSS